MNSVTLSFKWLLFAGLFFFTISSYAQEKPFQVNETKNLRDIDFQNVAQALELRVRNFDIDLSEWLIPISTMKMFETVWDRVATIYIGKQHLFYVDDQDTEECPRSLTIDLCGDEQCAQQQWPDDCHENGWKFKKSSNIFFTEGNCGLLVDSPSKMVCLVEKNGLVESFVLFQTIVI